ncbi:uncharacterized protein EI90DRAFT_2923930 [Cantharellus anzutake]|uniref:uncharacterized protein n=1 Tax=Cantharellus anzutake TaxID=1750568 RepID=UPI00190463E2|nr:uncharacterized protein EI90DRAFT_2923930 [Cantharellus anzutake]KAF8329487.1 hypothetical protein EI90DRAFT_2923930 [Cantharellus anzutake]
MLPPLRTFGRTRCPLRIPRLLHSSSFEASYQSTYDEYHDVVIVGGGPVGLALAASLGSSSITSHRLSVALIEASNLDKIRTWNPLPSTYSNRVSSITNESSSFLKKHQAWRHVNVERTAPIRDMHVWDGISDARITFSASSISRSEMARLTENLNLQRALLRRIDELSGPSIRLFDNVKVNTIVREMGTSALDGGGWPIIVLSNGRSIRARLLVGADGFNSPVRSFAGIPNFGWAYPTHAVVATLQHHPIQPISPFTEARNGLNTTAYQRHLPTGPIAFLPLTDNISSLVWSTTPEIALALKTSHSAVLSQMVNAAFRLPHVSIEYLGNVLLESMSRDLATNSPTTTITPEQLGNEISFREKSHGISPESALSSLRYEQGHTGIPPLDAELYPPLAYSTQPGTQASFPLRLSHATTYIGEGLQGCRVALVGDAAHTIHPLAGQGLNMGLGDVECLVKVLEDAVGIGSDIGSYTSLLPYHQGRYATNHMLLSATDKLHKIYSMTNTPSVWARSVGVEVLNELHSVKGTMMSFAGADDSENVNPSTGKWNAVATGVEAVGTAEKAAKAVALGLGNVARSAFESVLRSLPR